MAIHLLCNCLIVIVIINNASGYGTCDDPYHIEKNTVATSDSHRDYSNAYDIFPFVNDQDASKFKDGMCAYQMKLELDDSCFKIHSPTTFEHDHGLLSVEILEKEFITKWKSAMSSSSKTNNINNYDSFFDFNFAFW
eukprot:311475_1